MTVCLLLTVLLSPAEAEAPVEIAAAIKRLGADRFAERQAASEFLWRAGDAAVPALEEAVRSGEPEVRLRAAAILDNLRYGLYADTPPEVASLVRRFRRGDRETQRAVLHALLKRGRIQNMVTLLRISGDERLQSEFLREAPSIVPQLLAEERYGDAAELLALAADPDRHYDQAQRNYAAFLLMRGGLDEKIAELQAAGPPDDRTARLLGRLLLAQGDFKTALAMARKANDKSLAAELLFRLGRWQELVEEDHIPGDQGVERLGFSAAFHQLAGDDRGRDEALAGLEKLAGEDPDEVWMCGEALMIAGAWDRAERLFAEHSPTRAFDLLASQLRLVEAFRVIGIDEPRTGAAAWYARRAPALVKGSKESKGHFYLGLDAATALYRVGEQEESQRLFAEIADTARTTSDLPMRAVIQAELKLGLRHVARQRLLDTISLPNVDRKALVSTWFPEQRRLTGFWWEWLHGRNDEESEQDIFVRVERILHDDPAQRMSPAEFETLLDEAERSVSTKAPAERREPLEMLGETCLLHNVRDRALQLFQQRANLAPLKIETPFGSEDSSLRDALMRVGDLLAEDQKWEEAAQWYRRAAEADPRHPLPLYLEGDSLERAGRADEGRSLKERASLICLGDVERRSRLAEALDEREQPEAALEQWDLVLQLGPWNAWEGGQPWAVSRASRRMGNHLSQTAPLEAAEHWRRWLMYLLKTNSAFLELEHYAQISHLIHKTRARGLAESGDWPGAAAEARLAQKALSGDINFPLEFVPMLDESGRAAEADEVFRRPFDAHRRLLEQFPNSAWRHNNLAWLAARCDREPDAALEHAQRAVELSPDKASYLDTLAEVHFRRGDAAEAARLARRCIELEPDNDFFREQLDRFESDP
ncbi:MAG: hypothetical protein KY475_20345 [Planctomycetes bacterium]|nr:hypothetical protein [Planctomycetota bacterium]